MKRSLANRLEVRKNRLRRRRRAIAGEIGVALAVVATAAFLCFSMIYGYSFALCSDYFKLKETIVKGVSRLTEEEVKQLAGVDRDTNILAADLDSIVAGIKKNPWVREVGLRRVLPDRLIIEIVEREPLALIRNDRSFYLLDQDGTIFKNLEWDDPVDLPVMTGFSDGESLDEDLVRGAMELIENLELRKSYPEMRNISEIRGDHLRGYSLCTIDHRLYILGFGDYERKFGRLRSILFDLTMKNVHQSPLVVDLADPDRVVVRRGGTTGSVLNDRDRRMDI